MFFFVMILRPPRSNRTDPPFPITTIFRSMGIRVAQGLSYPMVNDYISIGNGEFVVEIYVNERLEGSPLNKVLQGVPDTVHVLLIKRKTQIFVHPADDFTLSAKDVLVLLGQLNTLKAIAPKLA